MTKKKEKIPTKIKWMQRFFRVAGEIAPSAMLPVLVKMLFTPRKQTLKPPHLELIKKAKQFKFTAHEFKKPSAKIKLSCYEWGKDEKLVLLVHGWDAKALDYYKMVPVLLENGYRVIAFDGPAHGQSEGAITHLMHFRDVLNELIGKIGIPYAIVGHSMGGGASTYLLMEYEVKVNKLVLIATPAISKRFFDFMFGFMKVPLKMQKLFYRGMEEEVGEPIERYNLITRKEPIKANEILVMYDPEEEVVPAKEVRDFIKSKPGVKAVEIKGAGHNGIIKNKQTFTELLGFLNGAPG